MLICGAQNGFIRSAMSFNVILAENKLSIYEF